MSTKLKIALIALAALAAAAGAFFYYQNTFVERTITLMTSQGQAVTFTVEIADTPQERERGLMFREQLAQDRGMLFIFPQPEQMSFWMKNTKIPLDILFISADGRVRNIYKMARPMDETPLPSNGQVQYVLEINGGLSDALGIRTGDILQY